MLVNANSFHKTQLFSNKLKHFLQHLLIFYDNILVGKQSKCVVGSTSSITNSTTTNISMYSDYNNWGKASSTIETSKTTSKQEKKVVNNDKEWEFENEKSSWENEENKTKDEEKENKEENKEKEDEEEKKGKKVNQKNIPKVQFQVIQPHLFYYMLS